MKLIAFAKATILFAIIVKIFQMRLLSGQEEFIIKRIFIFLAFPKQKTL